VLLPPLESTSDLAATGGRATVTAVPFRALLGGEWAVSRRGVAVHGNVEALLTLERGEAQAIAAPAAAWRAILAVGVGAGAALPIGRRARVTLHVAAVRAALGRSYAVEGVPGAVLDPPRWQALGGLGLEWIVSP